MANDKTRSITGQVFIAGGAVGGVLTPDDASGASTRQVGMSVIQIGGSELDLVADFSDVGDGYHAPTMFADATVTPPIDLTADFSDVGDGYHAPAMIVNPTVLPPIVLTADFSDVGDGYHAPTMFVVPSIDLSLEAAFTDVSTMTATPTVSPPIVLTADFSDVGDGYHAPTMFATPVVARDVGHLIVAFDDDGSIMTATPGFVYPPLPVITTFIIMG